MDDANCKKHIVLLIALSIITVVIWNNEITFNILNAVLPGDVLNQSILSHDNPVSVAILYLAAIIMLCLPIITLLYCIVKLLKNRHSQHKMRRYQKNWLIVIFALNILFYSMLGVYYLSKGRSLYPDVKKLLDSSYYNIFIKDGLETEVSEYITGYLKDTYDGEYSFTIKQMSRSFAQDTDGEVISCQIYENNFMFNFYLAYNDDLKEITYDNFKEKLLDEKMNRRMKELIDGCIGEGLTLYVRWDWQSYYLDYPLDATADEILSGKYGRLYFNPIIFVYY